jgi:hypothetical protein
MVLLLIASTMTVVNLVAVVVDRARHRPGTNAGRR